MENYKKKSSSLKRTLRKFGISLRNFGTFIIYTKIKNKNKNKIPKSHIFSVDVWLYKFSLKIFVKPQLITMVLKIDCGFKENCKTTIVIVVFMIFLKL